MRTSAQTVSTGLRRLATIAVFACGAATLQADDSVSPGIGALDLLQRGEAASALEVLGTTVDQQAGLHVISASDLPVAAGGLYRAMSQRSTDEQYDLLRDWSLPTEGRQSVRILTTLVPQHAPPVEFARLLGERPRDTVFPIAEVGGVRGLFCSGWMLVRAADDTGRLSRLIAELEPLAEQSVPGAGDLLLLARLAGARSEIEPIEQELIACTNRVEHSAANDEAALPFGLNELAIAAAALEHKPLRPAAENLLQAMLASTYGKPVPGLRRFLRMAHAVAVQRHRGESGPEVLFSNRLKYWVPVSGMTSAEHVAGGVNAAWLVHEDHILHLTGTGNDVLFFRYPLTGQFTFTCETQNGGEVGTDGGLVYGGLSFEALGRTNELTVADADFAHPKTRLCPFVRHEDRPTFNRVSIRSTDEGPQFLANLHPMWHDTDAALGSPWLGLRSFGDRRPVFRNFKLTGEPVIPREVYLTREDAPLRGWRSDFLGQTQPAFQGSNDALNDVVSEDFDWSSDGGIIQSARRDGGPAGTSQSLLCYQRPLLDAESVSYEFRYTPGEFAVHPALGRLVFLIEPDGVRIHWITDAHREWTGLPADNATLEPLNRRGPAELPLSTGDWNHLTIARTGGRVTITLNDVLVYERPLDDGGDQMFGLYHDRSQSAVRVRNVVMRGDWPESLPEEFLENPAALAGAPSEAGDRLVLNSAIGEKATAQNVRGVCRHAAGLEPPERFDILLEWVLPNANHTDLRVSGEFTQADPSPLTQASTETQDPVRRGAELISPVFDLLDAAARLQKLDQLQQQLAAIEPATAWQQRALQAMIAMVAMEQGDTKTAEVAIGRLTALAAGDTPDSVHDQWPETLVVVRVVDRHQAIDLVGDLLLLLYNERTARLLPRGCDHWHTHIGAYIAKYRNAALDRNVSAIDPVPQGEWIPATRQRFTSRGAGSAHAVWGTTEDGELLHVSGHQEESLLYRIPLRGEFEFECDVASNQTQVLTAGQFCGPNGSGEVLHVGDFRRGGHLQPPVDPPLTKLDRWVRYRAVFHDGVCTIFISGQKVYEIPLPEHHSPWIGVRCWWRSDAGLRDVRITGDPEIPTEVVLSALEDFTGWLPYFDETIGFNGARWQFSPDLENGHQIVAKRIEQLAGTYAESLLRYIRPLAEDGTIEYEFYYQPGRTTTHPALDRLAFLLDPAGVREHWITDGREDRTDVPPDNSQDEPQNGLGSGPLPLRENAWNQLQLSIVDCTVTLILNGESIYRRDLEPFNQRTFGLFRYADTEVRVRNVMMRGNWQREIPPLTEQALADPLVAKLNAERDQLDDEFSHDFGRGIDDRFFQIHNRESQAVGLSAGAGVQSEVVSPGDWTQVAIVPRFTLHGDFDLQTRFDLAQFSDGKSEGHISLLTRLDDKLTREARMVRGRQVGGRQYSKGQLSIGHPDGTRHYVDTVFSHHSHAGRLRLARRGETVYFLYAENDSAQFRLIGQEPVSGEPTTDQGIRLLAVANRGGRTRVLFKDITLRADRLTLAPSPAQEPPRPLFVMEADGSNLRQVTQPLDAFTHLGSPEFSPDGRRIALDMSRGSTTNSHVVVIDLDGSEPQDLGPGCMPSYSADAQKIVFSQPGQGVVTMNADGTQREVFDRRGWGAQWSPDGRWIAYGRSGNIVIASPGTGQSREVLVGDDAQRYSYTYWNPGWSRDSRMIAFKGRNRHNGQDEVAVAHIDPPDNLRVLYVTEESIQADFAWSPGDEQLLFSKQSDVHRGPALFVVDPAGHKQPTLFPGQPNDLRIYNCAWSPDGNLIAFSSQLPPEQLEWPLTAESSRSDSAD